MQFMRFAIYLFLFTTNLFCSTLSFAEEFNNRSAEKKAEYYLALKQQLPEVFQSQGGWFVNPSEVAQKESVFLKWFNLPETQTLMHKERPTGVEAFKITASVEKQEIQSAPVLEKAAFEKIQEYLKTLNTLSIHQAKSESVRLVKQMNGNSANGVLTGLVQSLPNELKGHAFKLPSSEKIAFLDANLTDEQLRRSFRSTIYKPEQISKSFLLNEVRSLMATDQKIAYYTLFARWKQNHKDLAAVIDQGLDSPADFLSDLEATGSITAADKKRFTDATSSAVSSLLKAHVIQGQRPVWTTQSQLSIEVMPEHHAIYRGSLNCDCFTTYAYGFAYAPSERTLMVRDGNGKFLVTVYSIVAELQGKKVLYVHEMGHSNVSSDVGPQVMRALYNSRHKLGVDAIAIGDKGMHHYSFGTAIKASAKPSDLSPLNFYDKNARAAIGDELVRLTQQGYSKSHDMPEAHPTARIYEPIDDQILRISAVVETNIQKNTANQPLNKNQLLELALDLASRHQTEILNSIFSAEASLKLMNELTNSQEKSVHDFYMGVAALMKELDLPWSDQEQRRAEPYLQKGFLNAVDAWSESNKDTASSYMAAILKADIESPPSRTMLKTKPQFYKSQAFAKLLKYFLRDTPASLTKAQILLDPYSDGILSETVVTSLLEATTFQNFELVKHNVIEILKTSEFKLSPTNEQNFLRIADISPTDYLDIVRKNPTVLSPKVFASIQRLGLNPNFEQRVRDITAIAQLQFPSLFVKPISCNKAHAG